MSQQIIFERDPEAINLVNFADKAIYASFTEPSETMVPRDHRIRKIISSSKFGGKLPKPVWLIEPIVTSTPKLIGSNVSKKISTRKHGEKITDNQRVRLLEIPITRGGEKLFLKVWSEMPNSIGTAITLAEAFAEAGSTQKNTLNSARYYIKRWVSAGKAESVR